MPQPIDLQTELARVSTMDRVQQIADRMSLAAHQRLADDAERQQVNAETQTQEAEQKSEEVERDLRRRNPYGKRRKGGQTASGSESERGNSDHRHPPDLEEHHLDVTV